MRTPSTSFVFGLLLLAAACEPAPPGAADAPGAAAETLRVATYNVEDVRTDDLARPGHPRLQAIARTIRELRPDVLLLNEVAYDQPGAPGFREGDPPGRNAARFVEAYLAAASDTGAAPLRYRTVMLPTNTGEASGLDLDDSGEAVTAPPPVPSSTPEGRPGEQTPEGRAYGNDAWGFGTFPGQYGMALLVREDLEVLTDSIRTFRLLPWSRQPEAGMPLDPETGEPWYEGEEGRRFRLSSKSHWDVPVRLPGGAVLHVLASHPTPPAFDGPEQRNVRRNRAEIRFWADYLDAADYVVDDSGRAGGLREGARFVLLGDLNADLDEGRALDDPVGTFLLSHPRVGGAFVPTADSLGRARYPDLDPDDTAQWGLRVDYVLPSADLEVVRGGVHRPAPDGLLSDHFPVWIDVVVGRE